MSMWIICLRDKHRCILDVNNPLLMCHLPTSQITDTISGENTVIPSPSVDINSSVDIDCQSNLDIPIAYRKRKKSCTQHPLQ